MVNKAKLPRLSSCSSNESDGPVPPLPACPASTKAADLSCSALPCPVPIPAVIFMCSDTRNAAPAPIVL